MHNAEIEKQEIQTFYRNNQYGWIGSLILFAALLFIMQATFTPLLIMYLALLVPYMAFHITNHMMFKQAINEAEFNIKTWRRSATFISAYIGFLIGSLPVKYLDLSNAATTYIICTILILSMFGSSMVSATCRRVHFVWSITSILPVTFLLLQTDNFEYNFLGVMILLTGIPISIMMTIYNHHTLHNSFKLRFENITLMQQANEAKEEAEEANADKSRFLAASSHDLRQPLHALNLFLEALANTINDKQQSELLNKAQKASLTLGKLLNALLDISKLDYEKTPVTLKSILIDRLINEIVDECKPFLERSNIHLQLNLSNDNIYSDKILLSRIIRNLLRNAIDHSHAKEITIKTFTHEQQLVIEICDNGIGIPDHEQNNIYSEFYQLNNPERDRNKGLGLGLAIVKRLADLLQYDIHLNSQENEGSCFQITIPLAQSDAISPITTTENEIDLSGIFIIIIEDEKEIRDAIRILLKLWHCELLIGDNLQTIETELDNAQYPTPDILLIDYRLRDNETGLDAIHALHARFEFKIPSILITGETDSAVIQQITHSGHTLLNKPVSPDLLKRTISQMTDQMTNKANHEK